MISAQGVTTPPPLAVLPLRKCTKESHHLAQTC